MTPYGIDNVISLAKDLERKAYRFYSFGSSHVDQTGVRQLFEQFSDAQHEHLWAISQLGHDLAEALEGSVSGHESGSSPLAVQWFVVHGVTMPARDLRAELTGQESAEDLLELAVEAEGSATAFYAAAGNLLATGSLRRPILHLAEQHCVRVAQLKGLFAATHAA